LLIIVVSDSGVHSVSLVISAKLEIDEQQWTVDEKFAHRSVIERLNQHLPDTIRVFHAKRVPGSKRSRGVLKR
jgi:tRNA U38,U39,U40 pseudouridine synthase TruA